jgi:sec-independent protein translocase protein TatA
MAEVGPMEIVLLLLVVLLLFGSKRLPEIGRSLGSGIREFRGSLHDTSSGKATLAAHEPSANAQETLSRASIVALGSDGDTEA